MHPFRFRTSLVAPLFLVALQTETAMAAPPAVPVQPIVLSIPVGSTAANIPVGATDPDAGAALTYSTVTNMGPANGSVTYDQANRSFTYNHNAGASADFDRFMISVSDGTSVRYRAVVVNVGTTKTGDLMANVITGGLGPDTLNGLGGNDTLNGDPAQPWITNLSKFNDNIVQDIDGIRERVAFSPDGTKIVFASVANLAGYSTGGKRQIFIKDLRTGVISILSTTDPADETKKGDFDSRLPVFSPDGGKVAFDTFATNLGDISTKKKIAIADLATGEINFISGDQDSTRPVFSPDGASLVFASKATDLNGGNGEQNLFVHTFATAATKRVSVNANMDNADGDSAFASFSPDGASIVFHSAANNLLGSGMDQNTGKDIFLYNMADGAITCLSTCSSGPSSNFHPVFSPDGSAVVFGSTATNLLPNGADSNGKADLYIKKLTGPDEGSVTRVSTDGNGQQLTGASGTEVVFLETPKFSPDGNSVVFVYEDEPNIYRVYKKDISTGSSAFTLISTNEAGDPSSGDSLDPIFSPDGSRIAFRTSSSNFPDQPASPESKIYAANLNPTGGNDILDGAEGNDMLVGGSGEDVAVYPAPRQRFKVTENMDGSTTVSDMMAGSPLGTDTLVSVEKLKFGAAAPVDNSAVGNNSAPLATLAPLKVMVGETIVKALGATDADGDDLTYKISVAAVTGLADIDASGQITYAVGVTAAEGDTFTVEVADLWQGVLTIQAVVTFGRVSNGDVGNDVLVGGAGDDTLYGAAGNDTIDGGLGADTMYGGPGNDRFLVDNAGDVVVENLGEGTDTISATVSYTLPANVENLILGVGATNGTGNSLANVITGNAAANIIVGGSGNDTIDGGAGKDNLDGGVGIDTLSFASSPVKVTASLAKTSAMGKSIKGFENLTGSRFNDTLTGNKGANAITGGAGRDILIGGKGADRFVYTKAGDSTTRKYDRIRGFSVAQRDKIDFSSFDANPKTAARDRFTWRGTKPFTKKAGELRFLNGFLMGDTTGNGKANFRIKLEGVTKLPKKAIRF